MNDQRGVDERLQDLYSTNIKDSQEKTIKLKYKW